MFENSTKNVAENKRARNKVTLPFIFVVVLDEIATMWNLQNKKHYFVHVIFNLHIAHHNIWMKITTKIKVDCKYNIGTNVTDQKRKYLCAYRYVQCTYHMIIIQSFRNAVIKLTYLNRIVILIIIEHFFPSSHSKW